MVIYLSQTKQTLFLNYYFLIIIFILGRCHIEVGKFFLGSLELRLRPVEGGNQIVQ